jgi:hypothetical protein
MEDMKDLPRHAFGSVREGLAEKFHMSEGLLADLNPGRHFDRAGESSVGRHRRRPKSHEGRPGRHRQESADRQALRQVKFADRILPRDRR